MHSYLNLIVLLNSIIMSSHLIISLKFVMVLIPLWGLSILELFDICFCVDLDIGLFGGFHSNLQFMLLYFVAFPQLSAFVE